MKPGRSKKAMLNTPASYLLAAVLAVTALGLTQCRMTEQTVTGVDIESATKHGRRSDRLDRCYRRCESSYRDCRRDEDRRHKKALRACDKLDTRAERRACREAESKLHRSERRECREALGACRQDCRYNEGAGQAGR
jgi:hypothetical protein